MKKHARPRVACHPSLVKAKMPELKAADVLNPEHVYHPQFVRWVEGRGVEASKRQARKFLSLNPVLRRAWPAVWKQHDRQDKNKKAA